MIKKFLLALTLFFITKKFIANNPILDFCQKNDVKQNIVLITYNIKSCAHCELPIHTLLKEIRNTHSSISIYLIINDSLTKEGLLHFCLMNTIDTSQLQIVYNPSLFNYFQNKLKNDYNICILQPNGKILYAQPSHKNQSKFFDALKDQVTAYIVEKTPITHPYYKDVTSVYFDNVELENAFILFIPSSNLLAMYGKNGQFIKQVFLDSLNLDYFSLLQKILSPQHYQQLQISFKNNPYLQKITLLRPKDIFNINNHHIGIFFDIPVFKDSIFNKDSVTYEETKNFVALLDTNLQLKNILFFENSNKTIVSPIGTAVSDSIMYVFNYSAKNKRYSIGKYLFQNNKLIFLKDIPEPENSIHSKYIPKLTENKENYYLVYYTKNKSIVYELNTKTDTFQKLFSSNKSIGSNYIFHTEKNNYLLLTHHKSKFEILLFRPDIKTFTPITKNYERQDSNEPKRYYFVFAGYIWEAIVNE